MNYNTNEKKTKECRKCKRLLDRDILHFRRDRKKQDGLMINCKECMGSKFGHHSTKELYDSKEGHKHCSGCKKELPMDVAHFYNNKVSKDGFSGRCKECYSGRYGVHQPNKSLEARRGYHNCSTCKKELPNNKFYKNVSNKTGLHSSCKDCEYKRAVKYKECPLVRNRIRQRSKKYRLSYYKTERGIAVNKKHIQIRRSRLNNLPHTYTVEQWERTLEAFGNLCAYCGSAGDLQQEHVIPLSKGGYYTNQNIIPACPSCNRSKRNKDMTEWYINKVFYNMKRHNKIMGWTGMNISNKTQQLSIL